MKRSFFLCAVCIMAGTSVKSQNNKSDQQPPVSNMESVEAPQAPLPPPALYSELPAVPPVPPTPEIAPVSPVPAIPPVPAKKSVTYYQTRTINSSGYDIYVHQTRTDEAIFVKRNSVVQKIKMETWKANRKMYEKKYGRLPFRSAAINIA